MAFYFFRQLSIVVRTVNIQRHARAIRAFAQAEMMRAVVKAHPMARVARFFPIPEHADMFSAGQLLGVCEDIGPPASSRKIGEGSRFDMSAGVVGNHDTTLILRLPATRLAAGAVSYREVQFIPLRSVNFAFCEHF